MAAPILRRYQFRAFVEGNVDPERSISDPARRQSLGKVLLQTERLLTSSQESPLAEIPSLVLESMQPFGWEWNGFYVLADDGNLHLGPAAGPPVCTPIESRGGLFTSGMCFDCIATNQTLVAYDVGKWPGYVSCDDTSELKTASSIVCPLRSPEGSPVAVWDVDATQVVDPGDVRFFDVFFASLAKVVTIAKSDLLQA